jgi:hypothetical protein
MARKQRKQRNRDAVAVGQRRYLPFVEGVDRVEIIELGLGDYNLKASFYRRLTNPVVVRWLDGPEAGTEGVVDAAWLYSDPLAASIESARLLEEADKD